MNIDIEKEISDIDRILGGRWIWWCLDHYWRDCRINKHIKINSLWVVFIVGEREVSHLVPMENILVIWSYLDSNCWRISQIEFTKDTSKNLSNYGLNMWNIQKRQFNEENAEILYKWVILLKRCRKYNLLIFLTLSNRASLQFYYLSLFLKT